MPKMFSRYVFSTGMRHLSETYIFAELFRFMNVWSRKTSFPCGFHRLIPTFYGCTHKNTPKIHLMKSGRVIQQCQAGHTLAVAYFRQVGGQFPARGRPQTLKRLSQMIGNIFNRRRPKFLMAGVL